MRRYLSTGLAAAALCAGAYAPSAQAAPVVHHKQMTVRLWRHRVTEPGKLSMTVRTRVCVKNVQAFANRNDNTQTVWSRVTPDRLHGHVFTIRIPFSRSDETGGWNVDLVTARKCDGNRFSYVIWHGNLGFTVYR